MKKLLILSSLAILAACSGKESENRESKNILENFSISVDTLVVDVGDELFNPGAYQLEDITPDQTKGYFLYMENEIHEIDLDKLKLLNRYPYQEDGPDAIPKYPNTFQALPNEELFVGGYAQQGVFSLPVKKISTYKIVPENIDGIPNDAPYNLSNNIHISQDKTTIVSLPNIFGKSIEGLAVISIPEMKGKILPLPALDLTQNYQIVIREDNGSISTVVGDFQRIQILNHQFIVFSQSTSDIYTFNWKTDSLQLISFPHKLVPLKKTEEISNVVDSRESLSEGRRNLQRQISFGPFYYDVEKEVYLRFASMNAQYDENGRFKRSDVYLFSYDKNFNLTGEKLIEDLDFQLSSGFMKGGKIYSYWVVEENPAFIVYTLNF